MENNKYYLQQLPLVMLMACGMGLLYVIAPLIIPQYAGKNNINFVYGYNYLFDILFFVSTGICTKKWQESLICLAVSLAMYTAGIIFIYGKEYTIWIYLYSLVNTIGPVVLFLLMVHNSTGRLLTCFLLLFVCFKSAYPNVFFSGDGIIDYTFFEVNAGSFAHRLILFFSASFPLMFQLIFCMEVINFHHHKTNGWKPRLLNLGNEYPKAAAIILQVLLNAGFFIILLNSSYLIRSNYFFSNYAGNLPDKVRVVYLVQDISRSLSYLFYIVMYGWYYRKFLLEYFVSYHHTSRLLYWLCYLPVIGIIVFLAATSSAREQKSFAEKQTSLSMLAGNSSTNVAVILIVLALLRLAWATTSGQGVLTLSAVISTLLLVWLIADKSGFFVNLYLNLASLAGLTIYSFFLERNAEEPVAMLYSLVTLNTIMLIMIFPALHLGQFEYAPDRDPDEGVKEGGDLFPEYSPYR